MAAKYVSSRLIKQVSQGTRTLAVEFVDRTTSWQRPECALPESVKDEFAQLVQDNIDTFNSQATKVAMKESEHQSEANMRKHYTAFELGKDGTVLGVKHLVKKLK
ncbi:hypothetical protein FQN55_002677 [Onygenales sp. PD_40]|nr:hypothetical protein FQN55_002677 [Onygenales sp. PD_40]KAK2776236.1 hypothetical protein FQN53_002767 [Emmonsiellopsis sp. PD_33]KAK2793325.1 hypothetical protein FQN52_001461 [Onygenales sp. PD_12]KAK2797797.1 hypothetical protein FQN51_008252 [Onygenales sp. PD_10]